MHVSNFWDFLGAILVIAMVSVILTKANTTTDLGAAGTAFSTILDTAELG